LQTQRGREASKWDKSLLALAQHKVKAGITKPSFHICLPDMHSYLEVPDIFTAPKY
jgi:hypothetical protein